MEKVKAIVDKIIIPTYPEPAAEDMPMFAETEFTREQVADHILIRLCLRLTVRIKRIRNIHWLLLKMSM